MLICPLPHGTPKVCHMSFIYDVTLQKSAPNTNIPRELVDGPSKWKNSRHLMTCHMRHGIPTISLQCTLQNLFGHEMPIGTLTGELLVTSPHR